MPRFADTEMFVSTGQVIAEYEKNIAGQREALDVMPGLAIPTDHNLYTADGGITHVGKYIGISNGYEDPRGLRGAARRFGISTFIDSDLSTLQLAGRIDYFNDCPLVHGITVPLGLKLGEAKTDEQKTMTAQILSHIAPEKDVDGLNEASGVLAGTAEGSLRLWQESTPKFSEGLLIVRGLGKVGRALNGALVRDGYQVRSFDKLNPDKPMDEQPDALSEPAQRALLSEAAVLFSATPDAHGLTPDSFDIESRSRAKTLVGIGFGKKAGTLGLAGEFSPELTKAAAEWGWRIISNGEVGRYVTSLIMHRTITAAVAAQHRVAA